MVAAERVQGAVHHEANELLAEREARAQGIPRREELIRLVVHGTLHALGRDHPEGAGRTRSAMWRRQERYVEALA